MDTQKTLDPLAGERTPALIAAQAEIATMRRSLSALTTMGADLAAALQRRNQEYEILRTRLTGYDASGPIELSVAATTDLEALQASLLRMADEKADLETRLNARDDRMQDFEDRLDNLRIQLDEAQVARVEAEHQLLSCSQELNDLSGQLVAWHDELLALVTEAEAPPLAMDAEPGEDEAADAGLADEAAVDIPANAETGDASDADPSARLGAAITAVAVLLKQRNAQLRDVSAQAASLQEQIAALNDEKSGFESTLQEKDAALANLDAQSTALEANVADLNTQVETLSQQLAELQNELAQTTEAKTAAESELTDFDTDIARLQTELDGVLGGEAVVAEQDQPAAEMGDETIEAAPEAPETNARAAQRAALAAAVAALVARQREQNAEFDRLTAQTTDLDAQLQSLATEKGAAEAALQQAQQQLTDAQAQSEALQNTVNDLNAQIDALNAQVSDLTSQLDAAQSEKATLEEQLNASQAQVAALDAKLDSMESTLRQALSPEEMAQLTSGEADGGDHRFLKASAIASGIAALTHHRKKEDELEQNVSALTTERDTLLNSLHDKDAALTESQTQIATLQSGQADLQSQLESATTAKDDLAQKLQAAEAELADLERQLDDVQNQLHGLVGDDAFASLQAMPEGEQAPASARLLKAGLVAGGVAIVGEQRQSAQDQIAAANTQVAALEEGMSALAAEKDALLAAVQEKENALADAQTQIDTLAASQADLQSQLDGALAAQGATEQKLQATETTLADLETQLDTSQAQLRSLLGDEFASASAASAEEQGDGRLLKAGLVAGGVTTVVGLHKQQRAALDEAMTRAASLEAQLNDVSAQNAELAERVAQLDGLSSQLEELSANYTALAASKSELDVELTARARDQETMLTELETLGVELQAREVELASLRSRVVAAAPFETAASLGAALSELPEVKRGAGIAALIAGVQPYLSPNVQSLTDAKGVGSVRQQRLYNAGIGTFWELASLPNDEMQRIFELNDLQLHQVDFEAIRSDAYRLARETDAMGRIWQGARVDDLESIEGIGSVFESRLYQAGICTYEQLAEATPEQLAAIVNAPELLHPQFDEWIAEARQRSSAGQAEMPAVLPPQIVEAEIAPVIEPTIEMTLSDTMELPQPPDEPDEAADEPQA